MFIAGVDGRRGGWVSFKVDLTSLDTSVELIDVPSILRNKRDDLAILAIDKPVGLLTVPEFVIKQPESCWGSQAVLAYSRLRAGQPSSRRLVRLLVRLTKGLRLHAPQQFAVNPKDSWIQPYESANVGVGREMFRGE